MLSGSSDVVEGDFCWWIVCVVNGVATGVVGNIVVVVVGGEVIAAGVERLVAVKGCDEMADGSLNDRGFKEDGKGFEENGVLWDVSSWIFSMLSCCGEEARWE